MQQSAERFAAALDVLGQHLLEVEHALNHVIRTGQLDRSGSARLEFGDRELLLDRLRFEVAPKLARVLGAVAIDLHHHDRFDALSGALEPRLPLGKLAGDHLLDLAEPFRELAPQVLEPSG